MKIKLFITVTLSLFFLVINIANAKKARYNSINELPRNLYLADVDGDTEMEFIQFGKNRVFSFETDFHHSGRFHFYSQSNFKKVIVGAFREVGHSAGRDDICFIRTDNKLECYTVSPDGETLWWWFRQDNFIKSDEQIVVEDYDNDGDEDIAVYRPSDGRLTFYEIYKNSHFVSMKINSNQLDRNIKARGRIYAGNFSGDEGGDLLFISKTGKAIYLRSVTSNSQRTFWFGFGTMPGEFASNDQVLVANIDGGRFDNIVKRTASTGHYTFYKTQYENGHLKVITSVDAGQLPKVTPKNSVAYFGKLAGYENETGNKRDDAIIYLTLENSINKVDARYDAKKSKMTYWYHYRRHASKMNSGWKDRKVYTVGVVRCYKENENNGNFLHSEKYLTDLFSRNKRSSINRYFMDISLGMIDFSQPEVFGPYSVTLNNDSGTRYERANECINNIGSRRHSFDRLIAHVSNGDQGATGPLLLLMKNFLKPSVGSHELLHTFGLPESYGSNDNKTWKTYRNEYDIMSAQRVRAFRSADFGSAGPNLMPYYQKTFLDVLPEHKYYRSINNQNKKMTKTITLTSVSRPESPNYLAGDFTTYRDGDDVDSENDRYIVEFRTKQGWDRAIRHEGILINRVFFHPRNHKKPASVMWNSDETEVVVLRNEGDTWENSNSGIKVKVKSINTTLGIARVEVSY
ncbi:MAG: hypothetical protein D3918_03250 [Candidatus Electrothrix sp. AX2]|nr:hypothetical protein [Candidatus Electrothrix gigas]